MRTDITRRHRVQQHLQLLPALALAWTPSHEHGWARLEVQLDGQRQTALLPVCGRGCTLGFACRSMMRMVPTGRCARSCGVVRLDLLGLPIRSRPYTPTAGLLQLLYRAPSSTESLGSRVSCTCVSRLRFFPIGLETVLFPHCKAVF